MRTAHLRSWAKGSARTAGPAKAAGVVRSEVVPIVQCPKCGGWRKDLGGAHGTRMPPRERWEASGWPWCKRNGHPLMMDCRGDPVPYDCCREAGWEARHA